MIRTAGSRRAALALLLLNGCLGPTARRVGEPPLAAEQALPSKTDEGAVSRPETHPRPTPSTADEKENAEIITLGATLRLAGADTIDVKIIESRVAAARAAHDLARSRLLPRLALGVGYLRGDGRRQNTPGEVFDVSRSSLSLGPQLRLQLAPGEAIAARLETKQRMRAAELGEARTRAETIVRSASLYLELLRRQAVLEVAQEAVGQTKAQVELSRAMVEAGAGVRAHLARARAAAARDEQLLLEAHNGFRKASVELAIWLRLEPGTLLVPADTDVEALTLVDKEIPVTELISMATANRPGLGELQALRSAAEERASSREWALWVPEVDVFAGYGWLGGGSGGSVGNFGDRFNGGASLSWSFEGLGFGEGARTRQAQAEVEEARFREQGATERIVGEVLRTFEDVRSLRASIASAQVRQQAATETFDLVQARFDAGDAIQLEVLEAARDRAEARAGLITATIEYNRAQHLLHYQVYGRAWSEEEPSW